MHPCVSGYAKQTRWSRPGRFQVRLPFCPWRATNPYGLRCAAASDGGGLLRDREGGRRARDGEARGPHAAAVVAPGPCACGRVCMPSAARRPLSCGPRGSNLACTGGARLPHDLLPSAARSPWTRYTVNVQQQDVPPAGVSRFQTRRVHPRQSSCTDPTATGFLRGAIELSTSSIWLSLTWHGGAKSAKCDKCRLT
jgi:hypothetical protein